MSYFLMGKFEFLLSFKVRTLRTHFVQELKEDSAISSWVKTAGKLRAATRALSSASMQRGGL